MVTIIIRGPAGVGKSTVAKILANKLGAQYFSYDDVMSKHNLDIIEGDGISTENFIKANDLILPQIKEIAVVDGCFYRDGQLQHLREHAECIVFTLTASEQTCLERNVNRILASQAVREVYGLVKPAGIMINTETKTPYEIATLICWNIDQQAAFKGWDFSYINGRMAEEEPPWNYNKLAKSLLENAKNALDMGTGGGELLATFAPFNCQVTATEGYPPNVEIAKLKLKGFDISVVPVKKDGILPFSDNSFDLILNRHDVFDGQEIARVLIPGGIFLTQQVDAKDVQDLVDVFHAVRGSSNFSKEKALQMLKKANLTITREESWSGNIEFKDVGAVVYYLKAIPWIVPGFCVDTHKRYLEELEQRNSLRFQKHRFLIIAKTMETFNN